MDFLREELSGLPPTVTKSILAEFEAVIRASRYSTIEDSAHYAIRCQNLVARLAASLQLALRIKETLAKQENIS